MITDLERWIDLWREEKAEAKERAARIAALEERILTEKRPGDTRFGVTVVEGHRLDRDRAKEVLTNPGDYDAICDQVPSAQKIRDRLGEDVLALCQVSTKPYLRAT